MALPKSKRSTPKSKLSSGKKHQSPPKAMLTPKSPPKAVVKKRVKTAVTRVIEAAERGHTISSSVRSKLSTIGKAAASGATAALKKRSPSKTKRALSDWQMFRKVHYRTASYNLRRDNPGISPEKVREIVIRELKAVWKREHGKSPMRKRSPKKALNLAEWEDFRKYHYRRASNNFKRDNPGAFVANYRRQLTNEIEKVWKREHGTLPVRRRDNISRRDWNAYLRENYKTVKRANSEKIREAKVKGLKGGKLIAAVNALVKERFREEHPGVTPSKRRYPNRKLSAWNMFVRDNYTETRNEIVRDSLKPMYPEDLNRAVFNKMSKDWRGGY